MKKVIVGMSGGVDSSVSALLLQKQGYEVEGMFMKNWEEDDTQTYCAASEDVKDAQAVCDVLQIPLQRVNFAAEYWDEVFEYFLQEYSAGRTPNPDILCNKEIKFKAFLQQAENLGAQMIAMGHYARKDFTGERYRLLRGVDSNKDQSYFLYTLNQQQLAKSLFPIGELQKPQVRELANQAHLPNFSKKDSTGICFIGERKFKNFLNQYLPAKPGSMTTTQGEVVGEHDGLMYYTIGQRQGLGIGGRKQANDEPWYVLAKDLTRNVLIVGQGHDHPWLFKSELICEQAHWVSGQAPINGHYTAKIRYRQNDQACELVALDNQQFLVKFSEPQRAITPGQSIVFYQHDECLGGAVIL